MMQITDVILSAKNLNFSTYKYIHTNSIGSLFNNFGSFWIVSFRHRICQFVKLFSDFKKDRDIFVKIESFVKNPQFCKRATILSKIHSFVKERQFCQKSKCFSGIEPYSKIEFFIKSRHFSQSFVQESKFLSKIEILLKNRKFCQK